MAASPRHRVVLEIPWRTALKLIFAVALVWVAIQLVQTFLVLVVAVLIAVTLDPVVTWLMKRGLSRATATFAVAIIIVAVVGGFLWLTWASLSDQAQYLANHFTDIEHKAMHELPGWLRQRVGDASHVESRLAPVAVRVSESVVSAFTVIVIGFVLTMYLLLEGRQTRDWLVAFVSAEKRPKVEQTLEECQRVIFGYVAGNVATSIFATVVMLTTLSLLNVPAALLLAVLAGVFDFVPVIGLLAASIPTLALSATVSGKTVLIVAIVIAGHNFVENYFLGPYVYGDRLKLSNLAVILAFAVGAELAGVIGALIALPLAAIYPSVERIWLRDKVGDRTVREHRVIERRKAG